MTEVRLRPSLITQDLALSKSDYFVDVQLWPTRRDLDARGWFSNFAADELEYAVSLFNAFVYFNEGLTDELFFSAVHGLSPTIVGNIQSFVAAQRLWRDFLASLIVTYVAGESPRPTDSGYAFARKARQVLELDEESQIHHPADALELLRAGQRRPVLFVDDFVGSGNQMTESWHRDHTLAGGFKLSFAEFHRARGGLFYYCPLVCTSYGRQRVRDQCPGLQLHAAHELDERDGLVHPDSVMWPEPLRAGALQFLEAVSNRAGISVGYKYGWKGFHDLGLAIAFKHSVPDATLPVFFWDQNGWKPLVRRT